MQWIFAADAVQSSVAPADAGSPNQQSAWHAYLSGTFGGGTVQISYSPDPPSVPDATSRWFAPSPLAFTGGGDVWFQSRFRKIRVSMTGSTTPNAIVEIL
jgi:hypothetical protein